MNALNRLTTEIHSYGRDKGVIAESALCLVLLNIVRWLARDGHGSCTVNAVDHRLGNKIKTETVITVSEGE